MTSARFESWSSVDRTWMKLDAVVAAVRLRGLPGDLDDVVRFEGDDPRCSESAGHERHHSRSGADIQHDVSGLDGALERTNVRFHANVSEIIRP